MHPIRSNSLISSVGRGRGRAQREAEKGWATEHQDGLALWGSGVRALHAGTAAVCACVYCSSRSSSREIHTYIKMGLVKKNQAVVGFSATAQRRTTGPFNITVRHAPSPWAWRAYQSCNVKRSCFSCAVYARAPSLPCEPLRCCQQ